MKIIIFINCVCFTFRFFPKLVCILTKLITDTISVYPFRLRLFLTRACPTIKAHDSELHYLIHHDKLPLISHKLFLACAIYTAYISLFFRFLISEFWNQLLSFSSYFLSSQIFNSVSCCFIDWFQYNHIRINTSY
jgi:hypothetical protein